MCSLFGMKTFKEFKEQFQEVQEGYDEDGHSYMYYRLKSFKNLDSRVKEKLSEYDENIRLYLDHINGKRDVPIVLKYFQYLAVLFTEIYLDFYFRNPTEFLNELTSFGVKNQSKYGGSRELVIFIPRDMRNLAFWMATGSGKTIIMHINYLQFMKYNHGHHKIDYDNIILITPNRGLSEQHMKYMKESNIPCEYFLESEESYLISKRKIPVKIIEITKFVEEKTGGGVSIDINSVGSKNIVFADEAHKGSTGDAWRKYREALSRNGFKFEYSATFGQALKKVDPEDELLQAYTKSILFDYSYKYFYGDGYGKDYRIINTKDIYGDFQDIFLTGNALSFYEQIEVYGHNDVFRRVYHIERPLWVFVGSRVIPKRVNKSREITMTDILKVVDFIYRFVNDEDWTIKTIDNILKGKSGILDLQGNDIFTPTYPETKFPYLRGNGRSDPVDIYRKMREKIFNVASPMNLYLVDLKKAEGEIALKFGLFGKYFGVINIGDKDGFLRKVREKYGDTSIVVEKDEVTSSLFERIGEIGLNVLIGARKFVEGWDSWRVSTMGLLNIGKTEGPLIIQLFGRGVRLHGYSYSLKRSSAISDVVHPDYLPVLERLNVFGIKANYMDIFREYLKKEGVPTEPVKEFVLKTDFHKVLKENKHDLYVPRIEEEKEFKSEKFIQLKKDPSIRKIILDLRPRASVLESEGETIVVQRSSEEKYIDPKYVDILDWDRIYTRILEFKREKGWSNLLISKEGLMDILKPDAEYDYVYGLLAPEERINPRTVDDLDDLKEIALLILKKYLTKYYSIQKSKWENDNTTYYKLTQGDKNFFESYILKIKEKDLDRFKELIGILEKGNYTQIYSDFNKVIRNVYIDVHLYQPLLAKHNEITIIPQGLNEGEARFIEYLKVYLNGVQPELQKNDVYVYVLRNRTRGKGIGFFETYGFYPDFIVWVKKKDIQHILFVEPHGLVHVNRRDIEKIELHKRIKGLEKELKKKTNKNITMDSYILSVTEYNNLKPIFSKTKQDLENSHILFIRDEGEECIKKMMKPYLF